jgi:hypothetical protein
VKKFGITADTKKFPNGRCGQTKKCQHKIKHFYTGFQRKNHNKCG